MSKVNVSLRTPKLRFPEFRAEPGWEALPLGKVLTEHGEKDDGKSEVHSVSVHKGVVNQIEHLGRSFAATDRSNYNLAKPHDIIYTKSPTGDFPYGVIKQNRQPFNVIVSPLYGVFTPQTSHLGYILDAYFESAQRTKNYLVTLVQKGAKNTLQITNATFLSKALYLPSDPEEQQKIAECLASLDALIGFEKERLEALKAFKKGLMQQLFPREGERVPRLRFPEFQGSGEWEEAFGNELFDQTSNRHAPAGLPILAISQDLGAVPREMIDYHVSVTEASIATYKEVKEGDFIISLRSFQGGIEYSRYHGVCSPAYVVLQKKTDLSDGFFKHFFKSRRFIQKMVRNIEGLRDGKMISYSQFSELSLPNPAIAEQRTIANHLSALETLIESQEDKVESLNTHKQGLMQQLFPSADELEV